MSEAAPELPLESVHDQATVEPAAPLPVEPAAPAVDESAQASAVAPGPVLVPVAPSADAAPASTPDPVPDLATLKAELDSVYSRLEQYDAENTHLKEQLALHASSTAVDAAAALKQIAELVKPFA